MIEKISEIKIWFFEKLKKIDRPLTRWIKEKKKKNLITKMRKWRYSYQFYRNIKDYKGL